jgi:hypothetical protein
MSKIAVVSIYGMCTPHIETDLELIEQHIQSGDDVTQLVCDGDLLTCDINAPHSWNKCFLCKGKRRSAATLLSKTIQVRPLISLTPQDKADIRHLKTQFQSVDELKQYKLSEFDIGYAVASSVITLTRDPLPRVDLHADLIKRFMITSFCVYRSMCNYLTNNRVDRVYCVNGRLAPLRAVVRACQNRHVEFVIHDPGHDFAHYALHLNRSPHERGYYTSLIKEAWAAQPDASKRLAIGAEFFVTTSNASKPNVLAYVTQQIKESLPSNWDASDRNIVIFGSSEDEYASVDESWDRTLYRNQLHGLKELIASFAEANQGLHLYYRMHPNLKDVKNPYTDALRALGTSYFTVIHPEDPVSTYAMLHNANVVVTFGSTVGIEATYWGKTSILIGPALYEGLDAVYRPKTHQSVVESIKSDLPPKDRIGALMYGYYFNSNGIPFAHFEPLGMTDGLFKGRRLDANRWKWWTVYVVKRVPFLNPVVNRFYTLYTRLKLR